MRETVVKKNSAKNSSMPALRNKHTAAIILYRNE